MKIEIKSILVILISTAFVGCGGSADHADLTRYIEQTKSQPAGQIDPLPPFKPYKSFSYGAVTLRSPFDPPVKELAQIVTGRKSNVKPDLNREKEYLEGFNLAALSMVGTLERDGVLWALIDDGAGGIHRVTKGNFLGKNHGKIVVAGERQIELVEIVSDGADGWVERPKVLQLAEKE
ncbi:type 4a pilus biogenesis lipoprotein PilP [Maricurvus nonylphenolicus]|uniref:pilus assembly protein PilP n=1 Tax=Maricurvus nonylphenolicus TaxID=1008307 RepID=UPI0036F200D3